MSAHIHFFAGWLGMLLGVISGAIIGLFFAKRDWMGGYSSFRRRLMRLGHIAFFGIGFLNILFALTLPALNLSEGMGIIASLGLLLSLATMSLVCFLAAWRKPLRHLFPIPVSGALLSILLTLKGLL